MAPPSASPCPPMLLVSALSTSPAPTVAGRNREGEAVVVVPGYAIGERVEHQPRAQGRGAKQVGRGDGVVHHIERPMLPAQRADARQVRDLGAGVGNGL